MTKEELAQYLKDNLEVEVRVHDHGSVYGRETAVKVTVKIWLGKDVISESSDACSFTVGE